MCKSIKNIIFLLLFFYSFNTSASEDDNEHIVLCFSSVDKKTNLQFDMLGDAGIAYIKNPESDDQIKLIKQGRGKIVSEKYRQMITRSKWETVEKNKKVYLLTSQGAVILGFDEINVNRKKKIFYDVTTSVLSVKDNRCEWSRLQPSK